MQFLNLAPNRQTKKPTFWFHSSGKWGCFYMISSNLLKASLLEAEVGKWMALNSLSLIIIMSYDANSLHFGVLFVHVEPHAVQMIPALRVVLSFSMMVINQQVQWRLKIRTVLTCSELQEGSHLFQTREAMWCWGGHCRYSPTDGVAGCLPELHSCWQRAVAVRSLDRCPFGQRTPMFGAGSVWVKL